MKDLVSIIMPSYNTGKYISETIKSVLAQTYSNWELLIVDDCSTDNTEEVISKYLPSEKIKYFQNKKNSGAAISRNYALRKAKGKWIAFLDSDDVWMPEKLEYQIRFMEENDYHFSYTCYEEMNEDSKNTGVYVYGPKRITHKKMYNYCWMGCLTVMYDANYVGLIQIADIKKNNDYAMWLKISKLTDCYLLDKKLARYRKRKGSISSQSYKKLIVWHYRLYRFCDYKSPVCSLWYTFKNIIWGIYKKIRYVRYI